MLKPPLLLCVVLFSDDVFYRRSKFLTTSRMIRLFSAGMKSPQPGSKIIYMDGREEAGTRQTGEGAAWD